MKFQNKVGYVSGQFKNMSSYPTSADVDYLLSLSSSKSGIDVAKFAKKHSIKNIDKLVAILNKKKVYYTYEDNNTK